MSSRPDLGQRERALAALHEQIRACRRCQQAGYLPAARPIRVGGAIGSRVILVGQAPGARSDLGRQHFIGPAGDTLERWFLRAGFPPGYFRQQVYLTAVTRCFPGKSPDGKGDRMPSPPEQRLCRDYLDHELELVRPELVILVGTLAIRALLGRGTLDQLVGTLQHDGQRPLLPLPHASPVSRWLNDPANRARLDCGLELLSECRLKLALA